MMEERELHWGETPWDNLSREELLREVQRLYSAATSAYSVIDLFKVVQPIAPYWGENGFGAAALEKLRQCIEDGVAAQYDEGDIYQSFFRYADDLLFHPSAYREVRDDWMVCDTCGRMCAPGEEGDACIFEKSGKLRKLTWDDLKPGGK
jgi:hypothetical protein